MVRQASKRTTASNDQNEDILFLLSCIRSRENALIFFLELFAMASCQKLTADQYNVYKQEFLQKQKINTQQIRVLIDKMTTGNLPNTQVKTFWMKLKSIIRVSVERARTLGMLTQSLSLCYDYIIKSIDSFYSIASPLKEYMLIQQLVKRRTIEALMATKHILLDHPSQDFGKIRSQTFLKGHFKPPELTSLSPAHNNSHQKPQLGSMQEMLVIKQESKKRKDNKSKGKMVNFKRLNYVLSKCQKNLADVMDFKIDYHLDKKKTSQQNQNAIYDFLFHKNIANHKIITKYIHTSTRLAQKLAQIKRSCPQRRHLSHSKLTRKLIPEVEQSKVVNGSKHKLARPKTSKQQPKKTLVLKGASVRTQKIYDLLKMM